MPEPAPERINVAVVGAGRRAAQYFRYVPDDLRSLVRLTAIADPNESNDLASKRPDETARLSATLLAWRKSLP